MEGGNLQCLPTSGRFLVTKYLSGQVKYVFHHLVGCSRFNLIVFPESELNKPDPVLSCRCLEAKVHIDHSYISLL